MNFREWIMAEHSEEGYPQFSFDDKYGTITVVLPNGKRYVYDCPCGPPVFNKWRAQIRAHGSNGWRILTQINGLIAKGTPNWRVLESPTQKPAPEPPREAPMPASSPGRLVQRTLF